MVASIVFAILEWGASHPKASISNIETKILRSSARQHERVADVLLLCETCWKFKGGKQRQRAIDELIQIVEDANRSPRTRGLATIGLGIACTSETRKLLLDLLTRNDLDDFVAWCGVEAIRLLKDHSGVELAIITLCDDKEHQDEQWARNRARAVYLLGYLRQDSSTAERLRLGLQDSSPFVRGCAVEALAQMDLRTGAARRRIELLLDDEIDPQVLRKIAEALGHIGVASTIARLQPFLQCDVARTRWAMRQAIDDIAARHMS